MKDYQNDVFDATIPLPAEVRLAMDDIAQTMREGLLAMAVTAGLGVMTELMAESVTALCGPKGRHQPERSAVRHGSEDGSVTLGGRRVPVRRPRVRATDGTGEKKIAAYEAFADTDLLGEMAMTRMLAKLSCRRYGLGLEPVGEKVTAKAKGTSKSAVSRRFIAKTETALAELLAADLATLDLVALMIDGVHFGDHLCVVALGIGVDGVKHPLAVVEGSTENTATVTDLLTGLRGRGLDTGRPILVVIDGAKALRAGVEAVWGDKAVIGRCQLHKIRNVKAKLPEKVAATVTAKMAAAYRSGDHLTALAALEDLARQLDHKHPGAAASLREGLAETLTVLRLGVPPTLARTLRSTNAVESMIEICRDHSANVKNWSSGTMALRWCAAGMGEATKQFRRVNGHLHLPALRKALDTEIARRQKGSVTPPSYATNVA